MTTITKPSVTPPADRRDEAKPEPCAVHEIAAVFVVRAQVCEGTAPAHLIEYVRALLENREHELHEDIFDELESLPMTVTAHPATPAMATVLFPACGSEAMEEMLDAAESPAKAVGE